MQIDRLYLSALKSFSRTKHFYIALKEKVRIDNATHALVLFVTSTFARVTFLRTNESECVARERCPPAWHFIEIGIVCAIVELSTIRE